MMTLHTSWLRRLLARRLRERRGDEGGAAVELALLLPILLLMLSGTFDFSRALYETARLQSAARAGVQFGTQSQTTATNNAGMIAAARADANDVSNSLTITPVRTCVCSNGATVACTTSCSGNLPPLVYVKVTVQGNYSTLFDYPYVSNPIALSRSVEALVP